MVVITATILLLEHFAREHDWTAVSLGFLGCSFLYRISIMGALYHYYHLFSQNFTGWHDSRDNRFVPLQSKVCRRMEGGYAACPYEGKVQPTRCWGCKKEGHVLWSCPNRAAQPRRAEAQYVRKAKRRKCGECDRNNHKDDRCSSVRLWGEGWGLK